MSDGNRRPHITVVGDLILDRYLIGDATKLNPEMPGVVIRVEKEDDRLGGAAAVAMIAAGFGAKVTLAGVVGDDEPGHRLRRLLDAHSIESHLWIDGRPTTWKQRIVARGQLRPDRCDRETTTPVGQDAETFLAAVPLGDLLLISDYGKGVCTHLLLKELVSRANAIGKPVLVDPARARAWSDYGPVTLIKANLAEAADELNAEQVAPIALATALSKKHRCQVVVTLGEHGLVCAELDQEPSHISAIPVDARDVCGAGDTVFAALGLRLAHQHTLTQACQFATAAAGDQVATIGITIPFGKLPISENPSLMLPSRRSVA